MTKTEALAFYDNNGSALARDLGITKQAVSAWLDGPIPRAHALSLRYEILPARAGARKSARQRRTPKATRKQA